MPDIFISYSSRDRPVAERVQSALADAGYDVFWDQDTPAGIDWDSWIRERLHGSACVVVLWTRASIESANVRHEAIVAREAGKLLPVMVDDLKPSDFPMGLYMVQGLKLGRSAREFEAGRERLLGEVRDRVGERDAAARAKPARAWLSRRRIAVAAAVLILAAAAWFGWSWYGRYSDPNLPPVTEAEIRAPAASEAMARERVARSAETALSGDQEVIGTSWAWFAGQLVSASPQESRAFIDRYFAYLAGVEHPECGCWFMHNIPHSIGNSWVVIASARFGRAPPPRLLEGILAGQHPEGWWTISLNGIREPANAATHATAMLTVALAEARRAGAVPPAARARVDAALRRASTWLNRGPELGADWADYPNDERREQHIVFAAMATVATHVEGQTGARPSAAAFIRSATELPEPTSHFPSGAYVELSSGERYIDEYRHPVSPWVAAAAVLAYPHASSGERATLRGIIRAWFALDLSEERLLRQDWIVGETLFLRAIAVRELAARAGGVPAP